MAVISIAPMLDWSDRHYRYFMRQITQCTTLYSEMIVADALLHGNHHKLLQFDQCELPVVVQLGGNDPEKLAQASIICEQYGYSAINLNVGCPSNKVQSGNFGACLMANAQLIGNCIARMQESVQIPITIKHRIGLDYNTDYNFLYDFVATIAQYSCTTFVVHARNAILNLSPKENREIPPLKYEYVYKLKQDFPQLTFIINGGIKTIDDVNSHLQYTDGVMLGRIAYYNPYLFSNFDQLYYNSQEQIKTRQQIVLDMIPYLERQLMNDKPLHHITRHMLGLYYNCALAKRWRLTLSQSLRQTNSINELVRLTKQLDDSNN
jgi:tRNA-dihydrouridine synthase A